MTEALEVRLATQEDEAAFIEICLSIHREIGRFPVSVRKLRDLWERYIYGRGGICGVIGPVGGQLQGAVYLTMGSVYYSEETMLDELFVHVLPEFRASSNAKNLLNWCKTVADQFNVALHIGVASNAQTEAKIRFLQRHLGKPVGAYFEYIPKGD
jgi:hypothetical protein